LVGLPPFDFFGEGLVIELLLELAIGGNILHVDEANRLK
jgi:hypothetical protein